LATRPSTSTAYPRGGEGVLAVQPRSTLQALAGIAALLGLAIIGVGVASFKGFIYSQIIYTVVGGLIAAFSLALIPRIAAAPTDKRAGEVSVAHAWWIFSGGVGGLMVYLAPLFNKGHPAAAATLLAASLASLVIGLAMLAYAKTRLGAPLTV